MSADNDVEFPTARLTIEYGLDADGNGLMAECWEPVVGFEGLYEVSDHGNVRSLDRVSTSKNMYGPFVKKTPGRALQMIPYASGHLRVNLSRDGKVTHKLVHRLVLEAFRGPCPPGHEACHWDDDPTNNHLDNLRWGTSSENAQDKVRNGNDPNARKTHCPQGHEYTVENTYLSKEGHRHCQTCRRERKRRAA